MKEFNEELDWELDWGNYPEITEIIRLEKYYELLWM
jgi:hypothetical protein